MRVLISPVLEGNQYQCHLIQNLQQEGIDVSTDETVRPPAKLLWRVLRDSPDVVHIHWIHPYFLFGTEEWRYSIPGVKILATFFAVIFIAQVRLTARLCDRMIWTVHNLCNHEHRYPWLDRWVGVQMASTADLLQVWDESTKAEAADYFGVSESKLAIVPHGGYLNLTEDSKVLTKSEACGLLDITQYDRVLLFFGMIRPYKQVPTLIEIFSKLPAQSTCLIIAGKPLQTELREQIRRIGAENPNILLNLRYIPEDEIPILFAAADFVILPYDRVFNSGAAILAMGQSTPVVAPRKGSLPSVLPPGNILYNELEDGLRRAISADDAEIEAVGHLNREKIESEHDWRVIIKHICELYQR
jgi:glycosyltransferase involved in cell wall biosynthesis